MFGTSIAFLSCSSGKALYFETVFEKPYESAIIELSKYASGAQPCRLLLTITQERD